MSLAALLIVATCTSQPEAAFDKFKVAFSAALQVAAPGYSNIVTMEKELDWKAVTYRGPKGLQTKVRLAWVCAAPDEEIVHVARHEVCHIRLHLPRMISKIPLSDEERARMENEAEICVMLTQW